MKKVFILLLVFFCSKSQAQHIIFSENFDGFPGYNIMGWHHTFTGAVPWFAGLPYEVGDCMSPLMNRTKGSNKVACIPDCSDRGLNNNNSNVLMYTPAISLSTTHGAWLSYESYFEKFIDSTFTEQALVLISTDSGNTWTTLQDVPANPSLSKFSTYYIDLSAYDYAVNIWIGFKYSDDSAPVNMKGWAIDNVNVFVPAHKDLALISMTPDDSLLSYTAQNTGISHSGTVYNAGLDTITSFVIKYRQGSGPVKTNIITGVSIPRFSTYNFTHTIPDTVTGIGTYNVTMWVELAGDTSHANDTQKTTIRGAYFIPYKRLAIEEGTGTWDSLCPQGWVYMNQLATSDVDLCQVSVHDGDIMADTAYAEFLYYLHYDYVPYMLVDRKKIEIDSVFNVVDAQKKYFGFADLSLKPVADGSKLTVMAHITPAIDITGDLRLALIVTEDDVTGTTSDYDQLNNYAGGHRGTMGGFEIKPGRVPAADMYYNFVARSITPSPDGSTAVLPSPLLHSATYDFSLSTTINPAWHRDKLRAIVLLLRDNDTTVLNSNKTQLNLGVKGLDAAVLDAGVYPNPSQSYATVYFNLEQKQNVQLIVTDISGRTLYQREAINYLPGRNEIALPVAQFPTGLYLITLLSDKAKKTMKLDVIH